MHNWRTDQQSQPRFVSHLHLIVVVMSLSRTDSESEDVFTVENVVDKKVMKKKIHYLVKWEGYDSS